MYLHTAGAVLGAFVAGGLRRSPEEPPVYAVWQRRLPWTFVFRHLPNPQWLFGLSLVLLLPVCPVLGIGLMLWTAVTPGDCWDYVIWNIGFGFRP